MVTSSPSRRRSGDLTRHSARGSVRRAGTNRSARPSPLSVSNSTWADGHRRRRVDIHDGGLRVRRALRKSVRFERADSSDSARSTDTIRKTPNPNRMTPSTASAPPLSVPFRTSSPFRPQTMNVSPIAISQIPRTMHGEATASHGAAQWTSLPPVPLGAWLRTGSEAEVVAVGCRAKSVAGIRVRSVAGIRKGPLPGGQPRTRCASRPVSVPRVATGLPGRRARAAIRRRGGRGGR